MAGSRLHPARRAGRPRGRPPRPRPGCGSPRRPPRRHGAVARSRSRISPSVVDRPARRSARRRAPPPGRPPARPRAPRARARRRRAHPGRPGPERPDRPRPSTSSTDRRGRRGVRRRTRLDVGRDAQVVEQVPRLRQTTPMCSARIRARTASGRWLIRSPWIRTVPAVRVVQPGQAAQQRRLARPGRPDHAPPSRPPATVERHARAGRGSRRRPRGRSGRPSVPSTAYAGSAASPLMRAHRRESETMPPRVDVVRTRRARQGQYGLPAALSRTCNARRTSAPPCRSRGSTAEFAS